MTRTILICSLIYGVISLMASFLFFNNFVGIFSGIFVGIAIIVAAYVIGIYMYRGSNNGHSSFKENLKIVFGILLLGSFISAILGQVYTSTIPEERKEEFRNNMIDNQFASYESWGQEVSPQLEESFIKQSEAMFSLKGYLMGLPFILVMYGGAGAIVSLIMRKDPVQEYPTVIDSKDP